MGRNNRDFLDAAALRDAEKRVAGEAAKWEHSQRTGDNEDPRSYKEYTEDSAEAYGERER